MIELALFIIAVPIVFCGGMLLFSLVLWAIALPVFYVGMMLSQTWDVILTLVDWRETRMNESELEIKNCLHEMADKFFVFSRQT